MKVKTISKLIILGAALFIIICALIIAGMISKSGIQI